MSVSLVWATPDADRLIADMARVSSPQNVGNDATRLISYLIRHRHWSPFEMTAMCVSIETTRDIGRQILRHRSFKFQEASQRYMDVRVLPAATLREARMQDAKNRQSSTPCGDDWTAAWWRAAQQAIHGEAERIYAEALSRGIAKEQARAVLPEGLTSSHLYMHGDIRSWLHYCALRRGPETQAEHRAIATAAWGLLRQVAPACVAAFDQAEGTPA